MGIVPLGNYEACCAAGDYLYAVDGATNTLVAWDISDPENPSNVGIAPLNLGESPVDIAIYRGICYAISADSIFSVNVDNYLAPTLILADSEPGEDWSRILVVGDVIYVAGDHIGHIDTGVDPDTADAFAVEDHPTDRVAGIAIEGRRLFEVEVSTGFLRSYRIGGFYCPNISTGSLSADEIFAEVFRGRHAWMKGEIVASGITIIGGNSEADTGVLTVVNYIKIGSLFIFWGAGTPEAVFSAPTGSLFLRTDGGAGTSMYVKEAGGSGNTGWAGK